jgi:hypothetical protein
MPLDWLRRYLILSAVNNQITVIVVESWLFRSFRAWAARRSAWLGQLVRCDLCFGTWVSFLLAAVFRPTLVETPRLPGASSRFNRRFRSFAAFLVDSFAIALGGRVINEILGLLQREVAVKEEQRELLAEEVERIKL